VQRLRLEHLEIVILARIHTQNCRLVAAAIAIVGCRPDGHKLMAKMPLEAILGQLMSPAYEGYSICAAELLHHIAAKEFSMSPRRCSPSRCLLGIAPEEIRYAAALGDLMAAVQLTELIQLLDFRRQATMNAKYFPINNRREGQEIKDAAAHPPDIRRSILGQALLVESVGPCGTAALVVAPQQAHLAGMSDLEGSQQQKGLHAVLAPIHQVTQEQVAMLLD